MKNQKIKSKLDKKLIAIVLSLIMSSVALLVSIGTVQMYLSDSRLQADSHYHTFWNQTRLKFCYDNQIHPCDDTSVADWNENNPDNRFKLPKL